MNILFFDTETTGLPTEKFPPGHPMQPHITQLGFILEVNGVEAVAVDALITPDNWRVHDDSGNGISAKSTELTGITQDMCEAGGIPIADAMDMFLIAAEIADFIVCHNVAFDSKIVAQEYARLRPDKKPRDVLCGKPLVCTMKAATPICKMPKKDGKTGNKWPKLIEAHEIFFGEKFDGAHSAIVDIRATRRVFDHLFEIGAFDEQFKDLIKEGRLSADIFA